MSSQSKPRSKQRKKTIPETIGKRYFQVYDPIFGLRIHVLLNHRPEDYERWLNRRHIKDVGEKKFEDFSGWSCTIENEKGQFELLIFVSKFNWAIKCQGTLIHEITHTVVKLFNHNNIPFNSETQEFFAHMIGRIYEDIGHKLLKWS